MGDVFHEYMSKRITEVNLEDFKTKPGPVITISRAAGCFVQTMATDLTIKLNEIQKTKKWNLISKEVLHESAEKLSMHPKKIKSVFKVQDRSLLDDIMHGFLSKDYQLERKVRNTVINVIHRFGIEGYSIIMGRAGSIICSDIDESLHIRIEAPLEWRIKKVMRNRNLTKNEALSFIINTENDRKNFKRSIKGKEVEIDDYDITINQSKFNDQEIIELILCALKFRRII